MEKYTLFISDLHLSPSMPLTTKLFEDFAHNIAPKVDELYILGDLFKFWAGDDDRSTFNEEIKKTLKTISEKIPVYLMPGNRDFLLGEVFTKDCGCKLISDPYKINLYGQSTLLTHGDLLCTKDIKHRIFRALTRLPLGITIFLKFPLKFRIWLAANIQKHSAKTKLSKDKCIMLAQFSAIEKLTKKFNVNQIIHGHTHDAETEEVTIDGKNVRRISLGEWNNYGNIMFYYSDGHFEFKNI